MRGSVLVLLALVLASCGMPTARHAAHDVPVNSAEAARAIAAYRAANGLKPLAFDGTLARVAAAQARANAEIGDLSHEAGGTFSARLASFGAADRPRAAENLAMGSPTIEATLAQWKASPGHNKNLLLPEARSFGIARADSPTSRGKYYWALVVGE